VIAAGQLHEWSRPVGSTAHEVAVGDFGFDGTAAVTWDDTAVTCEAFVAIDLGYVLLGAVLKTACAC
jgi:hypothetical protein